MLFCLADNSLNNFPLVLITISKSIASSCFMYSRVCRELSSMSAKLCNVKFATANRSCMDDPCTFGMASQLCTSSVASRIHSCLQKMFPKMMHMLRRTRHVETKLRTFTFFKRILHLSLSIPNTRSTHMRVELWKVPVVLFLCQSVFVTFESSQYSRGPWIRCIANQGIRRELAYLVILADFGPSP